MKRTKLMLGDNMESFKKLPDNSIDSVVTDGPYGLSFMNKKWDYDVPSVEFWKEVYRVLKPGGHVLSFGGTRTYHRMVVNIEDAGFEIRDQIMWLYGSGFPKSHNIGKAVDKLQGNDREEYIDEDFLRRNPSNNTDGILELGLKDGIDAAKRTKGQSPYEGWGTALKPANEPICVARKPLSEKSVAENVLKWGTGGINVDGCRVGFDMSDKSPATNPLYRHQNADKYKQVTDGGQKEGVNVSFTNSMNPPSEEGRFPANIILDEIAGELLDEQSGISKPKKERTGRKGGTNESDFSKAISADPDFIGRWPGDNGGGASRFFYQAKVSKAERNMGLDEFDEVKIKTNISGLDDKPREDGSIRQTPSRKNTHPTVKPVALMAYLCRLVTPPNGIVLDPFMGSGSTGIAARLEGFKFLGMELDKDYFKIAESRIENFEEYRKFLKK